MICIICKLRPKQSNDALCVECRPAYGQFIDAVARFIETDASSISSSLPPSSCHPDAVDLTGPIPVLDTLAIGPAFSRAGKP